MSAIINLRLATAIIEAVLRASRRLYDEERLLEDGDALVLQWLQERNGLPGAELAWRCGRNSSNMHRTLRRLRARRVVEPLPSGLSGKTCGWALTEYGRQVAQRMQREIEAYDRILRKAAPNIDEVAQGLLKVMQELLRPADEGSLTRRLVRPERMDPLEEWDL